MVWQPRGFRTKNQQISRPITDLGVEPTITFRENAQSVMGMGADQVIKFRVDGHFNAFPIVEPRSSQSGITDVEAEWFDQMQSAA